MTTLEQTRTSESLYIPLRTRPPFVSKLGRAASEIGLANAVVDVFGDAGITFELEGDLPSTDERGLIIASDHRQRIEPLLVQAAMSYSDRDASYVIAMPTSFAGRIMQATGNQGKEHILTVVPGASSAGNKASWKQPRNAYRQRLYPHALDLPKDDVRAINAGTINRAAQYASTGDTVTIFPAGNADDPNAIWRRGVGQIISQVSPEARDRTDVAILRSDTFSLKKVMASLVLRDAGIRPRKQTIVMQAVRVGTVGDLYEPHLAAAGQEVAQQITDLIHESYKSTFRSFNNDPANLTPLGNVALAESK